MIFNPIHVDQLSKFIFKNIQKYKGVLNLASFNHISKYNFFEIHLQLNVKSIVI